MKRFIALTVLILLAAAPLVSSAPKPVVFRFTPTEDHANMRIREVFLAGTFNGWNPGPEDRVNEESGEKEPAHRMRRVGSNYIITLRLAPGEYPYKFVINSSEWITDETAEKFVEDGFGGKNSVKVVK